MNEPLVCVVVLNWNGWADTVDCLQSLGRQDYANAGVIVVDNGSSDGSPERLESEFPAVTVIRNAANLGFAAGTNIGIEAALSAGAEFVMLLNNDTVAAPDLLTALVSAALADSRIGIVGAKVYYHDRPQVIFYAGALKAPGLLIPRVIGVGDADTGQYDAARDVDYVWGQAMMIRRGVLERVGLLDERFFLYYEDRDYCLRTRTAGFRLVYAPAARVWHKIGASTRSDLGARWRYRARSLAYFYQKHSRFGWPNAAAGFLAESAWILVREVARGKLGDAVRLSKPYVGGLVGRDGRRK